MARRNTLAQKVAALGDLDRDDLVKIWIGIYGCAPPPGVRQALLLRAAAWHLQQKRLGGYSAVTRRLLTATVRAQGGRSVEGAQTILGPLMPDEIDMQGPATTAQIPLSIASVAHKRTAKPVKVSRTLSPGARLIRDWNGHRHIVEVVDGGFLFEDVTYRSLTAIAARITGAHWSGPRFFGL